MSWDAYVSDQLLSTGNVKSAAICGLDGTTWANSADFTVSDTEVKKLVAGFVDATALAAGGMNIAGKKYFYLSGHDEVLRGKKERIGIHVSKTKTAIIIALYEEPVKAEQCAVTVEALADYLKGVDY